MALTKDQLEQQKQAEELLFSGPQRLGFAKGLFFGHFNHALVFPYPQLKDDEQVVVDRAVADVKNFCAAKIDAAAIDRQADIPTEVIHGLGDLGVLGMTAPREKGGRGFSQQGYCKILEVIGGHCSSTAVFVNAHHSIGIRALLLFGSDEQRARWLPGLVDGRKLAAFALTETEAGSDAANVQTTATPSADGKTFFLNGHKRYITNGGIAQVLTVMARTPVPGQPGKTAVTAFLVTPDMPGFEVVEERMEKCGIRGTATGRLAFHDMPVPAENILGELGKGLRVALTVLDFGRTTFGASCTGAARTCLHASIRHAKRRVQFKLPLAKFELIQKKIAYMAACEFAMEATTAQCASFIDRGAEDYMLETAILKVFATEALWTIVNDCLQIHGGQGYFTNEPYERMMRDARINQIGEGANEVLKSFIALVGMRGVGEELKGVLDAVTSPLKGAGAIGRFLREETTRRLFLPAIPVEERGLQTRARALSRRVRSFGLAVQMLLRTYREGILDRQLQQERVADIACDLYASSCTLTRLDLLLGQGRTGTDPEIRAGCYFLDLADRRMGQNLAALEENDDGGVLATAAAYLS
ncbi:MAG: acyl-CoA dehydrogenase family protein [Gemmataceae bacterium]